MNKSRSKRTIIFLIIIALVLLIVCLGLVYVYIATDFLKPNKELFFKYATQITDKENGFFESDLIQYFDKKMDNSYSNRGSFNVKISGADEEEFNNTNNMDITFSGRVDNKNSNFVEDISINYSNDVKLPFSIKKIGDTVGVLQSNYFSKKYIACNISDMPDSYAIVGETVETLSKIENISSIKNSEEDMKHIQDEYVGYLIENIPDYAFSEIQENGKKGYKLNLNTNQFKDVTIKMLEKLKDDKSTIDKLNEFLGISNSSNKISSATIKESINNIKNISEDVDFSICLYIKDGNLSKIQFNNNNINITIEKLKLQEGLQYKAFIDILDEDKSKGNISFISEYRGLTNLQNINESHKLDLEFNVETNDDIKQYSYNYNLNNDVSFEGEADIEKFEKDNTIFLSDLNEEQKEQLLQKISERLTEINRIQMKKLGLMENENPIINIIPTAGISIISNSDLADQTLKEIEEAEIATFNAKLELYKGTNISGATVKGLFTIIANLNESEENSDNEQVQIKEINFDGKEYQVNKQTLSMLKEEISVEDYFKVEFEKYEDTGKIYRVVINKK